MPEQYENYNDVPDLRRHRLVNKLILLGFFLFAPLLWLACLICLTGDIYTDEVGDDGFLVLVSPSTKGAAFLVLVVHTCGFIYILNKYLNAE